MAKIENEIQYAWAEQRVDFFSIAGTALGKTTFVKRTYVSTPATRPTIAPAITSVG